MGSRKETLGTETETGRSCLVAAAPPLARMTPGGGGGPTATPEPQSVDVPLGPPLPWACPADVRLCGYLRKQKSQRRRFFALRTDPARLECYESEEKFRAGFGGPARPRRSVSLAGACTISKRADARQRHLIVLYTRDSSLGVAAASEAEQQAWYSALLEVRAGAGPSSHEDPETWFLAPFQDVWPVTLRPKGLGRTRGLGSGRYRLCLGSGALSLLRKPRERGSRDPRASPPPTLRLSLLSVRRCGHADSFFFLELGRSAPTGPGELWLQAPDAVVAQSIHETVLAAMKRLGGSAAGGRAEPLPRDSPTSASRPPISRPFETPGSPAQSNGLGHRECLDERVEQTTLKTLARPGPAASYPKGLDPGRDYISMRAGRDYEPMAGVEAGSYVVMAPPGLQQATNSDATGQQLQDQGGPEYMPMNRFPPESVPSGALPHSRKSGAGKPGSRLPAAHQGIGGSGGPAGAQLCSLPPSEPAGQSACVWYSASGDAPVVSAMPEPRDACLNYVDLDLVPPLAARVGAPGASLHSYACIEF